AVRHVVAVPARRRHSQALAAVGAPLVGIEQHLLDAGLALLPVDDGLFLVGVLARVEVPAAAVDWRGDAIGADTLLAPRNPVIPVRRLAELAARVAVLRGHPRLDLGRVLVLEPAIRIVDGLAVQGVVDGGDSGGRPRMGVLDRWHRYLGGFLES